MNKIHPGSMLFDVAFEIFEWPRILETEKIRVYLPVIRHSDFVSNEINEVIEKFKIKYWGTKKQNRHLHIHYTYSHGTIKLFDEVKK